jgi:hypothetical protein
MLMPSGRMREDKGWLNPLSLPLQKWLNYFKLFEPGKKCLGFEVPTPNAGETRQMALPSLESSSQLMWLSAN